MTGKKAVFLDRDGTINADCGYVHSPESWIWLPGAVEALHLLTKAGFTLVVVSNQSGIARGYYTEETLHDLEKWVSLELAGHGIHPFWYHCPHHPDFTGACTCRKPAPGLLCKAAADLDLSLHLSWMIGDTMADMKAGMRAGVCGVIKIARDHYSDTEAQKAGIPLATSLLDAANIVLQENAKKSPD